MKRKFLLLVCLVMIVALVSTSCDLLNMIPGFSDQNDQNDNNDQDNNNDDNETCEHTYSAKWSSNSTEHWHAATCEHAELKSDVAAHVDAGEDGKCDVCSYEIGHTHTYEDVWTSDDTHHWKNATCTHNGEKGELAAHVDANSDGECDVCTAHVHVVDIYGKCTVCNEQVSDPDVTKIEIILPAILSNVGKVNGGKIIKNFVGTSVAKQSEVTNTEVIDYILGNSAAYYKISSESTGAESATSVDEKWYSALNGQPLSGVYRETKDGIVGDFKFENDPAEDVLVGYYYSVSNLTDAYGAENLLKTLYDLSQNDSASGYVYNYEDGVYAFSFNYLLVNSDTADGEGNHVDYFELEVSFTVADSGALTTLNVKCDCYTNSVVDEEDHDYTYDQNTNTITMKDTAVADIYTFVITQTEGERTYVPEHVMSDFIPEDFDIFVDEECTTEIGETVSAVAGEVFVLYLGNFTPAGSSIGYLTDSFSIFCESENVICFCDAISGTVTINAGAIGTYTVVLTAGDIVKEITVVAEEAEIGGGEGEQPENSVAVFITDNNGWFDLVTFVAPESGEYTFIIPAGYGAYGLEEYNTWGDAFVDPDHPDRDDKNGGSFTVSLAEGETYEFYVKSPEKNITVYICYTFEASDVDGGEDDDDEGVATTIVGGTYIGTGRSGTCTLIIDTDASTVSMNGYVYSYTFADGIVTVYINGNAMSDTILGVTLGSDGVPTSFVSNGDLYTVTEGGNGGDDTEITVVQGTYTGSDAWGMGTLTVVVDATTVTFNFNHSMMGPSSMIATYEVVDGAVVLYAEDGNVLSPMAGLLEINAAGVPVSADYNGNTYALTAGGSSEGGDDTEPEADGSEDNPYPIDSIPTDITFYSDTQNKVYYLYTATADGFITITISVEDDSWCDIYPFIDGEFDGSQSNESNYETVATFYVKEGVTYRIGLGTFYIAGETTFSLAFTEGTCTDHDYQPVVGMHPDFVEATCVAPGVAVYECSVCGEISTIATEIDPDAHAFWGEEEVIIAANCATETNGLKKVHCANAGCNAFEEVEISYSDAHEWDVQKETSATCTEDGEYYAVCTVCGMVESDTSEASGHYNYYLACGESGECMGCGETFTKEHYGTEATCTEAFYCYNCWSEVGEPLGHNYVDGVCTNCGGEEGATEIVTSGILYADEESTVTITEDDIAVGYIYFNFTPWESGNYIFNSIDLYVSHLYDNDGKTINTNDEGYYVLESYMPYIVAIELSWIEAGDYTITPSYIYPEGHQNNPLWIFGESATVEYPGDYTTVWHKFYASSTGIITVTADNEQASILISAVIGYELEGVGSVSMGVVEGRMYYIGVVSFAITEATEINLTLSYQDGEVVADGTVNAPYVVVDGENSVELGSWENVFCIYTAQTPGTLTLVCNNESYLWYATTDMSKYNEAITGEIVIEIGYGECVYVYVENNTLENATISFTASFEIDPEW